MPTIATRPAMSSSSEACPQSSTGARTYSLRGRTRRGARRQRRNLRNGMRDVEHEARCGIAQPDDRTVEYDAAEVTLDRPPDHGAEVELAFAKPLERLLDRVRGIDEIAHRTLFAPGNRRTEEL